MLKIFLHSIRMMIFGHFARNDHLIVERPDLYCYEKTKRNRKLDFLFN
jgi:hypothetical protein